MTFPPHRTRPDLCAQHGHPGVTYHPGQNLTWCLCGAVIREGNQVAEPHMACCGGPLTEPLDAEQPDLFGEAT